MNYSLINEVDYYNESIKQIKVEKTTNNPRITQRELEGVLAALEDQFPDSEILIRGETILNEMWTIKGYTSQVNFDEDYFDGRVADATKFGDTFALYINIKTRHDPAPLFQ